MMNKLQAVREIIYDTSSSRSSKTSLKRLRQATRALGLTDDETREIESMLDYRPAASEELYRAYLNAPDEQIEKG